MSESNTSAKEGTRRTPRKAEDMRGLWTVGKGQYMQLPSQVEGMNRVWALPGVTLDLDDDFVRLLCAGQEHKLTPAAEGATAAPLEDKRLQGYRRRLEQADKKGQTSPAQKAAVDAARKSGLASNIPTPDARPRKADKAKEGATSA